MTNGDFETILKTRRSVRIFNKEVPKKEIILKLIEMATDAPSACNVQGWRFIIVDDDKMKEKLVDAGGSIVIKNAPIGILVLYDNQTRNVEYQDHIQSAAAAIQNLLLGATYLGLNGCWICHLPAKKQVRKIFSIPETLDPIAYVLVGYKTKEPSEVPRKHGAEQITSYNRYDLKSLDQKVNKLNLAAKKFLIKIYYLAPLFLKKALLNKYLDKKIVKKFEN